MRERQPILVVDDESAIRKMIVEVLGLEGYVVATAANGQEALDFLARNPGRYLILLDLIMPVLDARGMLARLEQMPEERAKHAIILCSVCQNLEHAHDLRVDGYLALPFTMEQLLSAIGHVEEPGTPRPSPREPPFSPELQASTTPSWTPSWIPRTGEVRGAEAITGPSHDSVLPEGPRRDLIHTGEARAHTKVLAVASGGRRSGKTTTTINLGAYLANAGRKTLLIDLDPQSNTTTGLGFDQHDGERGLVVNEVQVGKSIYELLVTDEATVAQALKTVKDVPNLSLLPAKEDLYAAEIELVYIEGREFRLKRIIESVKGNYDYVLIDCPDYLGSPLIPLALAAADGVFLPLQCEYFALEGMSQLLKTIRLVRNSLNPQLDLFGVVLTMFDQCDKLAGEVVQDISQHFAKERLQQIIPRDVRLAEAQINGLTILQYDPRSPGALAYKALAEEVIQRAEQAVRL